jgi:hypothetical protein
MQYAEGAAYGGPTGRDSEPTGPKRTLANFGRFNSSSGYDPEPQEVGQEALFEVATVGVAQTDSGP